MNNRVRTVFNRRKQASDTTCATVEIVVCLGRERFYFSTGIFLNTTQWQDGKVINHPKATVFNEQIQKKITEFERIIIAMEVNGDDMTTQQFKTYLSSDGSNRRNFMAWMRERIQSRKMREGTRKGHLTTYKALQRFGKFKTFDDVTLTHIYEFDMFIREEETYTSTGKLIERSQAAIHNYHKRFKSYVSEAFRLGLIKENPYNRFQDKRGEKGKRPHLTKDQIKRLIAIRESENAIIISEGDHLGKIFFKDLYQTLRLNIFEYTFDEHDETVAYSLSIPFVSTFVFAAVMKHQEAPGTTFKKHMAIAKGLLSEDDYLLQEILFNPRTPSQVENIRLELKNLLEIISTKDAEGMKQYLTKIRKKIK